MDKYGRVVKKKQAIDKEEIQELQEFYKASDVSNATEVKVSKKYESRLDYLNLIARGEVDIDEDEDDSKSNYSNDDSASEDDTVEGWSFSKTQVFINICFKCNLEQDVAVEDPNDVTVKSNDEETLMNATNRLAIKDCDWENISSKDLMCVVIFPTILR